jgi:hypothetical protein
MRQGFLFYVGFTGMAYGSLVMNPHQVMNVNVSDTGLTRLSVEGDRIKDIFAYPEADTVQLHGSGHIFIAPPETGDPLFITLMTDSGIIQDLKLIFTEKPAMPVVLKGPLNDSVSKVQMERWMDAALAGSIPRSFVRESIQEEARYTDQVKLEEGARYTNGVYVLSLWTVSSRQEKALSLDLKDLINPDEAGKLLSRSLPPLGTTTLVMLSKKKGKKHG